MRRGQLTGNSNLVGAAWILVACLCTTAMTVCVRFVSADVHSSQIAFARCLFGLLIVIPAAIPVGRKVLVTRHFRLHLLRGVLAVVGVNCGFYALTTLPLVTVTALFFTAPLYVPLLAIVILGERVTWQRWVATAAGFSGALIVIGFDPAGFRPAMLAGLVAAVTLAIALVMGKKMSVDDQPVTLLLYFGIFSTIGSFPMALAVWSWPNLIELVLLIGVALFATLRSYCDIKGYASGEASFVAPFFYARIIFIGLAGYLLFAELPGQHALLGATVIIVSTFYIARREIREGGSGRVLAG